MCNNNSIFNRHGIESVLTLIDDGEDVNMKKAWLSFNLAVKLINQAGDVGCWELDNLIECIETLTSCASHLIQADPMIALHPYFFKIRMITDKLEVKLQRNNMAMTVVDAECMRETEECKRGYNCESCLNSRMIV